MDEGLLKKMENLADDLEGMADRMAEVTDPFCIDDETVFEARVGLSDSIYALRDMARMYRAGELVESQDPLDREDEGDDDDDDDDDDFI